MKRYDVVIIGAGCSGLSLAYKLIDSGLSVCVLEKGSRSERTKKTWSYWAGYKHSFTKLESNKYDRVIIKNHGETCSLDCSDSNYTSIDSSDFDNMVIPCLDETSNIDLIFNSNITNITSDNGEYSINFNTDTIMTKNIYDSSNVKIDSTLYQVFLGYFIKLESQISTLPVLMDFVGDSDFHFFYVLPRNDKTILVESTFFTKNIYNEEELKDELEAYIKRNISNSYTIAKKEYGVIPMTTKEHDNPLNINKIGIGSGATRASTGYTFINIQKQTDHIVDTLKGESSSDPLKSFRWLLLKKMDHVLLRIISDKPNQCQNIIYNMFKNNKSNVIIKFLSDVPSLFDIIRIVVNMPKLIFINYAIRTIFNKKI